MTKKKLIALSLFSIALVFLGLAAYLRGSSEEKIRPKRGDVVETIYGLGIVSADKTYNVRTGVAVNVSKVFVSEGEKIRNGKPVVQIDGSILKSPIDGTVTKIYYKDGELVAPQNLILTITNLEKLFLEISLEQQSVLRVKAEQNVVISFESLRNERFSGTVKAIYPRENQFIVRIEIENWPAGVLPGMTADAAILVEKKENVMLIPLKAIASGKVTRIRDGKKEKLVVKLGVLDNQWAEVISGNISETDQLLIRRQ